MIVQRTCWNLFSPKTPSTILGVFILRGWQTWIFTQEMGSLQYHGNNILGVRNCLRELLAVGELAEELF